jgi:hypothetical protein
MKKRSRCEGRFFNPSTIEKELYRGQTIFEAPDYQSETRKKSPADEKIAEKVGSTRSAN